ncbi:MAG: efflux RND transporter periplasmic adaptor subunit [Ignavibacteriaceae bacterium]
MKRKYLIIGFIVLVVIAVPLFIFVLDNSGNGDVSVSEEKQLYTCGMHPEIILDEPGNCPICEMKLTPIRNNNQKKSGERKILYWRAPMDPNEIYDEPGKSKMGMDLVPVYEDESGASGIVTIDPEVQQNMNIKTEVIKRKNLSSKVITNGVLTTDETREYIITTRVSGWVEKLYVNYTGQRVRKGTKLMDIYSPELVAAQQEFLTSLSYQSSVEQSGIQEISKSGDDLLENAIRKLQLLDVTDEEIKRLKETREVRTYLTLYAKSSGTVIHKNVIEGEKIMAGMPLLKIADLNILWLTADIYEYELSKVKLGAKAEIKYNFLPGKIYKGEITFIYPTLDPKSRTATIRINIPNYKDELKPSMFANVIIEGEDLGLHPLVPENAVLRSGTKDVVIIVLGHGKFKPQEVQLGSYADGYYQVLEGLQGGNVIVTSAQFLIDSESNLRAAISQFQSGESETEKVKSETQDDKRDTKNENRETKDKKYNQSSSLMREGIIDVESIDVNKDGKLFECQMDWNVLSDEEGRCPDCNMYLKEFTIDEVKANLEKHGFEYKN